MDVNGTLVWYYNICKREVWFMSRNIAPDQSDTNIDIGRFLHEYSYSRSKKEINFGNVKFDVLLNDGHRLVIGETKKSSKFESASKFQLLFYLKVLEEAGLKASGVLLYPEERKRVNVELNQENRERLDHIIIDIQNIIAMETPPPVTKINVCKNCGYKEYCFA